MADKDRFKDYDDDSSLNKIYHLDDEDDFGEEFAAEAAVDRDIYADDADEEAEGTGLGWLAIVLSVIGLFFLPIIMGAAGIIVGIIARRQGAKTLGAWAIGVGIAAIVIALFARPFF
ncbi:hypothetical protein JOD45_001995 [Scopulibacillus daqui]|uniref:DUF4190 domain-containing protein n=1 Tax=Scopulibacillus daqui TaxID=1469162 RepID=A0ABS2Q0N5_9BACL|nr:DUF4190 domain-containing protein [Scopulibacillus daqui]MBM7645776.1 hypothetical protein [Scopulibacillus daqui]